MYVSYNKFVVLNVIRGNLGEKKIWLFTEAIMKNKNKNTENHENIDLAGLMQAFLLIYWGRGDKNQLLEEVKL